MLSEHETLIARVNDHRIIQLARLVQMIEQPSQIVIDPFDTAKVLLQIRIVGQTRILFVGEIFGVILLGELIRIELW